MSWTKGEIVLEAFAELGYSDYAFNLQPEQLQLGLNRLDSMMATWNGKGIRTGYPLSGSPSNSSLDQDSSVPDRAIEAMYTNLAVRIGPVIGKAVSMETRKAARDAYKQLLIHHTIPEQMQLPDTLPAGAGNKPWRRDNPFIKPPKDPVDAGPDGEIDYY